MKIIEGGAKTVDMEVVSAAQREGEIQIKAINSVVALYGVMSKNKRAKVSLDKMNLIDDSTTIDLMIGLPDDDKVKCPDLGKIITREECLDYSGSHTEDCRGCSTGEDTKRKLLPKPIKPL